MPIKRLTRRLLALGGILLAAAGWADAPNGIEFTGYVREESGLTLALKNSTSGYTKWVAVGQEFEDYKVVRLDEKTDILTLTRGGREYQLTMTRSKVKLADAEPPPEIKKAVLNNLRQLAAAADQYYLENGVSRASFDQLVGPAKYVKAINPADGEDYRGMLFEQGRALQTKTSQGYVISYNP